LTSCVLFFDSYFVKLVLEATFSEWSGPGVIIVNLVVYGSIGVSGFIVVRPELGHDVDESWVEQSFVASHQTLAMLLYSNVDASC